MKIPKLLLKPLVFASLLVVASEASAQRRPSPRPTRKVATATAISSAPTFETLLAADSYKVYMEVHGVGQLIRSNSVSETLEPVMKLADPPEEFKTLLKWLNSHADDVMTSRMLVATWPTAKNVPDALVAIEFESPEEAGKFTPQLNSLLSKVLPTASPRPSPSTAETKNSLEETKPSFYLHQIGSLVLITPTPLAMKNLRPPRSKLLSDDVSFRVTRSRFSSEQVFIYLNVNGIELEQENRRKQFEEENKKRVADEQAKQVAASSPLAEAAAVEVKKAVEEEAANLDVVTPPENQLPARPAEPDLMTKSVGMLANSFFQGQSKMPDAIGFGVSFENDSFDVRALLIAAPGEKCDPIPFFPNLIPGPAIVPESPAILPADTEVFLTLSLDLPQIYAAMSKPQVIDKATNRAILVKDLETEGPFAEIEKGLKIKLKEDLLPLLGSEIVVSMPVNFIEDGRLPKPNSQSTPAAEKDQKPGSEPSFVIALSLKDKEGMRALLPRIVDSTGFKGAGAFAQTERSGDTELVSYGNMLSYAFIQNFLVFSADPATTKHVVDSYLKHETLSSDTPFKNFTRWQPRQLQGEVYVSPALMESYKSWANQTTALLSDQTRELLSRLSMVAQPITYSLSTDGLGTLHELHVPKNLVLMAVAGISAESNPSPIITNERLTISILHTIANSEIQYKLGKGAGSFGTIEQLLDEGFLSKEMMQSQGYKIEVLLLGDQFQVTAVPEEYGKTGKTSYFIDHTNVLRGGDHGGGVATLEDNPIN
ncbi:MAG TPA: DUF3352 domain-containing protein [Pyrinomonadaceae bacterium]|nr:DUF3352 domain-containing protein [Pyrinomonadaceae bacterium]